MGASAPIQSISANTSQEQARCWALTVRGTDCHSECPQDPQGLPRTPGFLGSLGEGRVITASWRSGWPPGGRGRVPESQGSGPPDSGLPICPEEGCPAGMDVVSCANRCPRRCSDLQEGIVCQEDQACQQGCRCPEGRCSLRARQGGSAGRQRGALGRGHQLWRAISPQGPWSRMVGVCPSSTASARMPRATAGPRGASTRRPATTARAGRGSSPARPSPARLLPTAPGAAGQPGVPAAARVGLQGSRAASGTGQCQACVTSLHRGLLQPGHSLLDCWGSWILSLLVTLCPPRDLALALVPGHPCLSLATSTPTLGFPRGGGRRDEGPGTISHVLRPGAPPRSSTSGSWAPECREEQSQSQPCPQPPCPPLCLQGTRPRSLGDSWLQDGCQQW